MTSKSRPKFWNDSKKLIEYCTDNELVVLKQRADKELEAREKAWRAKMYPKKPKCTKSGK